MLLFCNIIRRFPNTHYLFFSLCIHDSYIYVGMSNMYIVEESCSALILQIIVFYNLTTILHYINFYSFTICSCCNFCVSCSVYYFYYDTTSMLLLLLVMCVVTTKPGNIFDQGKKHKRNSLLLSFHLSLKALFLRICVALTEKNLFSSSNCSLFLFKLQYFWSPF